jgi:hypothetical protein
MRLTRLTGAALSAPNGTPVQTARTFVRIAPGRKAEVPFSFQIDPRTPPGRYPIQVQLEDQVAPLLLVVPEERLAVVSPASIELEVQPGEIIERQLAIENQGNVPIRLRDPEPVVLEQWDRLHAMIRDAVRGTETSDYEMFLNRLVGRAKEMVAGDRARVLVPHLIDAPSELAPGCMAVVIFRVRMPRELERGSRYRARLRVADSPLVLHVHRLRERTAPEVVE